MSPEDTDLKRDIELIEIKIKKAIHERALLTKKINEWTNQRDTLVSQINLNKLQAKSCVDWANKTFSWSDTLLSTLRDTFKLHDFRSQQLAAINATLSKKDVLLLMPTGGGKTLCYQLPAIIEQGVTLVVSPLLALIEDQIMALKRLGIHGVAMTAQSDKDVKKKTFEYLNKGTGVVPKLMYVTPEFLSKSKRLMAALQKCSSANNLNRIAIDEVHCCSQWGHDFRPDYNFLGMLRNLFPDVPILGVTATATNAVLLDTQQMLNLDTSIVLRAPFDRPNLNFGMTQKPEKSQDVLDLLMKLISKKYAGQSGIVYSGTINDSIEITNHLRQRGVHAGCYHADMEKDARSKVHDKWLNNVYAVVVATVAFGMGIDKPDVRYVIHYSVPKSMEALYQEAGRAGRDGKPADHVVFFRMADYIKISGLTKSKTEIKNVSAVLKYCLNCTDCRHNLLAMAFEQPQLDSKCNGACDNCNSSISTSSYDLTNACSDIYQVIADADLVENNLTLLKLVTAWFKKLSSNKKNKIVLNAEQAERIIAELILQNYLTEEKSFTPYSVNCYLRKNRSVTLSSQRKIIAKLAVKANLNQYLRRLSDETDVIQVESDADCDSSKAKRKRS